MKFKIAFFLFFNLVFANSWAQTSAKKMFHKLSRPEKYWIFTHPLVAKKAFEITKHVQLVVDSIKKTTIIGKDNNGGKLDAFKHAFWIGSLTSKIGKRKSLKLGLAHEKGNKIQFEKHQLEEEALPDSLSSEMDLWNNNKGAFIAETLLHNENLIAKIIDAINEGQLKIIKKDENGNYLTCENKLIVLQNWLGKWNIPKCLIASNQY